ncbi:hypothetical protein Scep_014007 [Stephania cephalantha]|uniref:Saccharopine dehydrogenase NADP binding domain-containing protein n=1 Tax=Stephania cephalantha TaxID=152367 RepID=A0AAP0J2Z6_9MAGN
MAGASSWVQMNQSVVLACAKESDRNPRIRKKSSSSSRVLILGGTGRVGGSTALALSNLSPDLRILVGGRNREKGAALVAKLGESSEFAEVDIDNVKALEAYLNGGRKQDAKWDKEHTELTLKF